MILLGINGGLGASDVARLLESHIDLKTGWMDYAREKTGIDRRIPLWPETIKAVKAAIDKRPTPKNAEDTGLVFITKHGHRWVRMTPTKKDDKGNLVPGVPLDAVAQRFAKLLHDNGLKRPGINFYALRHTVETIGGEVKDPPALDHIMGHARDDMASVYREKISDDRLKAVTDHIRKWLYPENKKG